MTIYEAITEIRRNGYALSIKRKPWIEPNARIEICDDVGGSMLNYYPDGNPTRWQPSQTDLLATDWQIIPKKI